MNGQTGYGVRRSCSVNFCNSRVISLRNCHKSCSFMDIVITKR